MKTKAALAVAGLAASVAAAPANDADCYAYGVGQAQCYRPTVTVAATNCEYTHCPNLANQCHAEWLWTSELVEVPCYNKCCPQLAPATVTSACAPCPTACSPLYTQTIFQYAATCTAPPQNAAAAGQAVAGAHGPSVMDVQAGLNKVLKEQGQKPLWYEPEPAVARRVVPPPPTKNADGSYSTPTVQVGFGHGRIPRAVPSPAPEARSEEFPESVPGGEDPVPFRPVPKTYLDRVRIHYEVPRDNGSPPPSDGNPFHRPPGSQSFGHGPINTPDHPLSGSGKMYPRDNNGDNSSPKEGNPFLRPPGTPSFGHGPINTPDHPLSGDGKMHPRDDSGDSSSPKEGNPFLRPPGSQSFGHGPINTPDHPLSGDGKMHPRDDGGVGFPPKDGNPFHRPPGSQSFGHGPTDTPDHPLFGGHPGDLAPPVEEAE